MTAPNIINLRRYNLVSKSNVISTTNPEVILANSANSNILVRVNNITIQNYATNGRGANISLGFVDSNRNTNIRLITRRFLSANTFVNFLDDNNTINLEEGDYLQANVDNINNIIVIVSYEVISDRI